MFINDGEFVDIAENFVGKYRRNVHRAVKGDGPYQLVPKLSHLEVTEDVREVFLQKKGWQGLPQ